MRLIDADKLRIKCHTVNDLQPDKFVVSRMMVSSEAIDTEPTVKAVPIEWIKNIISANKYLWEKSKERMFIDQGVVTIVNYSLTAQILSELIDRWERENEID